MSTEYDLKSPVGRMLALVEGGLILARHEYGSDTAPTAFKFDGEFLFDPRLEFENRQSFSRVLKSEPEFYRWEIYVEPEKPITVLPSVLLDRIVHIFQGDYNSSNDIYRKLKELFDEYK